MPRHGVAHPARDRGPVTATLVWWVVMAAVIGVGVLVALYAAITVATVLGTLLAMVVAGLRAWWRERGRRLPTR